jgi:hypothetical protein
MTAVVALGEATFELLYEDRDIVHASAIGFQESLDLSGAIRFLTQALDLLFEGFATRRTIAGFNPPIIDLSLLS